MSRWRLTVALAAALGGCGASLPPRYVIEQDAGSYVFRRYQKSLDAEIPVEDNPASAHLATYVERAGVLRVAPVTVTAYAKAEGLADAVRTVLRAMDGYAYGVVKRDRAWMWTLRGQQGDDWLLWPSGRHLVKMGVPEGASDVPEALLEVYLEQYPSDLDQAGRSRR